MFLVVYSLWYAILGKDHVDAPQWYRCLQQLLGSVSPVMPRRGGTVAARSKASLGN